MKTISVKELKEKMDAGEDIQIIDIREDWEVNAANFGAEHIPMGHIAQNLDKIAKDKPVVLHCRSGKRSARMVSYLEANHEYDNLYNLEGGIKAWAEEIDSSMTVE